MFTAALILFDDQARQFTLVQLQEHLKTRIPQECSMTTWRSFGSTRPRILVQTEPPMAIQIEEDDPDEVSSLVESSELRGDLAPEQLEVIRRSKKHLVAMSYNPPRIEKREGTVSLYAQTDLDPRSDDVKRVLLAVAGFVDGWVHDSVHGGWIT